LWKKGQALSRQVIWLALPILDYPEIIFTSEKLEVGSMMELIQPPHDPGTPFQLP
jgi:hypothetical protein